MPLETLAEATQRLARAGYEETFRAEEGGLRAVAAGRLLAPEELEVDEVVRFEGPSDPADEAALFALRAPDGLRGTFAVAYGAATPPTEGEMARRLHARAAGRAR
jgi:hypothetical protein